MFKSLKTLFKRTVGYGYYNCWCSGGVTYKPMMSKAEATEVVNEVITHLQEKNDCCLEAIYSYQICWQPYFIE